MNSDFISNMDSAQAEMHQISVDHGWWDDFNPKTKRNVGELIALIHSEASELLEAFRHGNPRSEHITAFSSVEEEMADIVIRVMDMAQAHGVSLGQAIVAKASFNKTRPHKHGNKVF